MPGSLKNQILRNGLLCCPSLLAAHSLVIQSVGNAAEPAPIRFLKTWGQQGDQPGEFGGKATPNSRVGGPQFLAFDSEGDLWTTEGVNCRVQQFSSAGKFLRGCGENRERLQMNSTHYTEWRSTATETCMWSMPITTGFRSLWSHRETGP
ncbi:hypothetical protein V6x_17550 [Gimesia chilikensis]|uniref:NHL repeat protein n=1 Tax=Gimesia chilikensis TaxID=2605989 RepID=A0A517WA00_9PLAN|nr:hypothetical protein [Gimesia chilikensis]QDU02067.1 hypothetical protein V6x_17550 [Gimesia chilikensis]